MMNNIQQQIAKLLADPEQLLQTKPYYRTISYNGSSPHGGIIESVGATVRATIPRIKRKPIPIEQLLKEYDPWSHSILYDENIPSITMKNTEGGWVQIEQKRMPIPYQQNIAKKQTLHLCNNPMNHILLNPEPTELQKLYFIKIKQAWDERNIDGLKTEAVLTQKSQSVVGMLFYHNYAGEIKARILKYSDGFSLITHKDNNGEHIMECVYYMIDDTEYLDCYDDTFMYRFVNSFDIDNNTGAETVNGWRLVESGYHGFSECPLIVKRGAVAWDAVQDLIELYERTYNTFMVIQNRHGNGALYIKGKLNQLGQKLAGSIVLFDNSLDPNADAKYLTPPSPQNMIETLDQLEYSIQKGSGTTFILPKDIKLSGDTSGIAVQLTQELDIETALQDVNDWQNFANKMMRLFKQGLARELVSKGEKGYENAITEFEQLNIRTRFVVWRPQSNEAYNQMLTTLHGAGGISNQTLVEKNTESCPDEMARIRNEEEMAIQKQIKQQELTMRISEKAVNTNNTSNDKLNGETNS